MLVDGFGRQVSYLRVSVTERCNFRCQYCMPEKPFSWVPKENLLSFEDLFLFIKVAIDEGITKIRITGGEPLIQAEFVHEVLRRCKEELGLHTALYTNGLLAHRLPDLRSDAENFWYLELGGEAECIAATERVGDELLRRA